jgi:hypothetical protein
MPLALGRSRKCELRCILQVLLAWVRMNLRDEVPAGWCVGAWRRGGSARALGAPAAAGRCTTGQRG